MGNILGTVFGVICTSSSPSLTGYAEFLGANDIVFGLLTGIPLAAAVLQIPFSILVSRTQKRKRYMMTYGLFSRALWIVIGLVPYFIGEEPEWLRLWSVIFLIGISSSFSAVINTCWMPWMADIVPTEIRGRWLSIKEGICSIAGVTMGLFVAMLLDRMPGMIGYTTVFVMGGILGVLDMVCFFFVKEVYKTPPVRLRIVPLFKRILNDKPFFRFTIFWTLWSFTANMSGYYLGRYALTEMGLSYMQFTLFGQVAASTITVIVISKWGKLLDQYGCKPVLWVSCVIGSLTPAFYLLSVPGSIWPTFLHNTIGAFFWSASNLAATSLQLTSSPDAERPSYLAFFSFFTSLFGAFLGVLFGGAILELVQSTAVLSSIFPDRYKCMIGLSVILRLGSVLLYIPRLENNREYTTADMLRGMYRAIRYKA